VVFCTSELFRDKTDGRHIGFQAAEAMVDFVENGQGLESRFMMFLRWEGVMEERRDSGQKKIKVHP